MKTYATLILLVISIFGTDARRCNPGTRFLAEDGCNWCVCSPDGMNAACTLMACLPKQHKEVETSFAESTTRCTPGKRFLAEDGCNWCICSQDGKNAACTLMACPPKQQQQAVETALKESSTRCTPGKRFLAEDGCNWCVCSQDGKNAACTLMACLPNQRKEVQKSVDTEGHCTPGKRFLSKDGCNWCICGRDGKSAACTLMLCP
ncbi:hypothetical protein O3M35_008464 [Rhynocoris fuscipes]|uniref:Pacifastin domain-containing protein n=1 Tax=Rhynocoris fuscipes TaxID=488301 RepID=A0AAW1D7V5_9HEMI